MKKVISLFSIVAILGFASCTKSLDPELNDLEIVFEELEGTATKAALTEINLDKYGDYNPSSQLLTAKLQYKSSGQKVQGDITYVWDVKCAAVGSVVDEREKSRNTLTAQNAGTGTVSVSATYKGQEVQSSNIPIKVTANALKSIRLVINTYYAGNKIAFLDKLIYDTFGFSYNDQNHIQLGVFEQYENNSEKRVSLWKFPSLPGNFSSTTAYVINNDVSISFPDIPNGYMTVTPYHGAGGFPIEGYWTYCYFMGFYETDSSQAGVHTLRVQYKGKTAEETFEIYKP